MKNTTREKRRLYLFHFLTKSPRKCHISDYQMFISITDFALIETDDSSHILITVINSMGKPEEIKRFNKKEKFEYGIWIKFRY